MSSARNRLVLVFITARQITWSSRSMRTFLRTSSGAFWGTRMVALPCRSSTESIVWFFESRFSVSMQIIFSFVFAGDLSASRIGVAALTSILCLSKRSMRLKRSWK